jgi:hypothetical protein
MNDMDMGEKNELDITKDFLDLVQPCNSRKNSCHRLFFAHGGRSMNPILWQGDLLEVIPYHDTSIKAGDIIIFNSPEDESFIVHRVISISSEGIHTKGDNNNHRDHWSLRSSDIIGKVIAATYSMKRRNLRGGLLGLLLARWSHSMYEIFRCGIYHMRPIYMLLESQDILYHLGTHFIEPKVTVFKGNSENGVMLLSGRRIIGRYNYSKNQWNLHCVYRLFIDENAIPDISQIEGKNDVMSAD